MKTHRDKIPRDESSLAISEPVMILMLWDNMSFRSHQHEFLLFFCKIHYESFFFSMKKSRRYVAGDGLLLLFAENS